MLYIIDPTGHQTDYDPATSEIAHSGTGMYYYDLLITTGGIWRYRWVATGIFDAAAEGVFTVTATAFTSS